MGETISNTDKPCIKCRYYVESEEKLWDTDVPVEWDCTKKPDFRLSDGHNPDTDGCKWWEVNP